VSDHFTLRLRPGVGERLRARARRVGGTPRALAQRYVDEGLRREGPSGRRAALVGSGLDVWEVVATVRENDNDLEQAASLLGVPPGLVQAAIDYYGAFREEIDAQIADNEAAWERGYAAAQAGRSALKE
jgi:uncharacterized protein (DUF433 family)